MIILGINAYHADASAAIYVDGKLIAATEEERFSRIKHQAGFPAKAIQFCLDEAGVKMEDVDHFATGKDPWAKLVKRGWFGLSNLLKHSKQIGQHVQSKMVAQDICADLEKMSHIPARYFKKKLHRVEHHRAHLASAFYASPFDEAALVSLDGSGDFTTVMIGKGQGQQMNIYKSVDFPHSIGVFYTAFTQLLGFPHYGDEYKVMGLAPYGKPLYKDALLKVIRLQENGLFNLDMRYFRPPALGYAFYDELERPIIPPLFSDLMESAFGKLRQKDEPLSQYHKDLAASVQAVTEQVIFHILKAVQRATKLQNVCIAGGVGQNSVANGKILAETGFKNCYLPPAAHDAGLSMGAALYVQHAMLKMERSPQYNAYTGANFSNEYIAQLLEQKNISYQQLADGDLYKEVVDCICKGGVVGWFQGRAEFGPRALGARSILADPRRNDVKEILNAKIKRRESFRPFAPSILEEHVSAYFERSDPAPFMEKVYKIRDEKQSLIPAVTHVDGTGRLQTVSAKNNPRYYALISYFYDRTDIPILVNTSFNENEPIVNKPEEALDCYLRTDMDMLVLENIILRK